MYRYIVIALRGSLLVALFLCQISTVKAQYYWNQFLPPVDTVSDLYVCSASSISRSHSVFVKAGSGSWYHCPDSGSGWVCVTGDDCSGGSPAASSVSVSDADGNYNGDDVEAVLSEVADSIKDTQVWDVCSSGCDYTDPSAAATFIDSQSQVSGPNGVGSIRRVILLRDAIYDMTSMFDIPDNTSVICKYVDTASYAISNTNACNLRYVTSLGSLDSGTLVRLGQHSSLVNVHIQFAGSITGALIGVESVGGSPTSYSKLHNVKIRMQVSGQSAVNTVNGILMNTTGSNQYLFAVDVDVHPVGGGTGVSLVKLLNDSQFYAWRGWYQDNGQTPEYGIWANDTSDAWFYDSLIGSSGGGGSFTEPSLVAESGTTIFVDGLVNDAEGNVTWGDRIQSWMSTSIADSGDSSKPSLDVTPTSSMCIIDCQDSDGCEVNILETSALAGQTVKVYSSGVGDITVPDVDNVVSNSGDADLEFDTFMIYMYSGSEWKSLYVSSGSSGSSSSITDSLGTTSVDVESLASKVEIIIPGLTQSFLASYGFVWQAGIWGSSTAAQIEFNSTATDVAPSVKPYRNDGDVGLGYVGTNNGSLAAGSNQVSGWEYDGTNSILYVKDVFLIEDQSTAPACDTLGKEYVDTSSAKCWCDGSSWVKIAGVGSCV
jgi:hypothetical protein